MRSLSVDSYLTRAALAPPQCRNFRRASLRAVELWPRSHAALEAAAQLKSPLWPPPQSQTPMADPTLQ